MFHRRGDRKNQRSLRRNHFWPLPHPCETEARPVTAVYKRVRAIGRQAGSRDGSELLQKLQGGRGSYRLQDASKTRRIAQRIKFSILMDEQQSPIALLQSTLQLSQSFFMIAQHGVDTSQIHGRNITPLRFRFQAAQNQSSFFLLATFYEG